MTEHIGFQTRGSNIDIGPISGTIGTNADRASGSAPMIAHAVAPQAIGFEPRYYTRDNKTGGGPSSTVSITAGGASKFGDAAPCVAHVVAPPLTATNDPSRSPQSAEVTAQVHAVLRAQYPEVADVCGTLADSKGAGGLNGQDAHTGRIFPVVAHAVHENQRAEVTLSPVVGTLKCAGGKPGQGYPTVLAPASGSSAVPYDLFQITAPINRQNRDERSPCHTLAKDNAAHAAVVTTQATHFDVYNHKTTGDVTGVLREQHGTNMNAVLQPSMAVRRLTPEECERLQGFPDNHTRISWKGKSLADCPDGPRYRALGNSMAVPVIRWIGRKIEERIAAAVAAR